MVLLYEVFTVGKTNKKDITILHCTMQQIQDITYAQRFCFSTNIMYKLSCKKSDLHYICTNKYSHHGTWKSTLDQNWSITREGSYQKNSIVSNFSKSFVFEYLNVIGQFSNWGMLGHGPPFDHRPSTTKSTFAGRSDVVDVLLVLTSRP